MKIVIGADHGGFEMKQQLAKLLASERHEVVDLGNTVHDSCSEVLDECGTSCPLGHGWNPD